MSPLTEPTRLVLKNYNTPAAIAGVAPTLDYRFALDRSETEAVTLTDKLTFSRTATCAYTDAGGNLALAGANVPRFDHSLTTRQSLGLLVEEAGTNILTYNQQFDNAAWVKSGATMIPNTALAPDGTFTAESLIENAGAQSTVIISQGGGNISASIFAKEIPGSAKRYLYIGIDQGFIDSGRWAYAIVDVATGTFVLRSDGIQHSVSNVSVTFLPNGWRRISGYFSSPLGAKRFVVGLSNQASPTLSNSSIPYTGDGTSGIYIWGAQLETGSFPTSYIPTTTATVTRSESATVSLAGLPATRTLVEKPAGCATVAGDTLTLNPGYTAERVMVFPAALSGDQITAIRGVM